VAARRPLRAVPDQPGRAVLYVRVSALMGREGERFHSPAVQVADMRGVVGRSGLREVGVVDDDIDVSGQSLNRPGVARIRAMVTAGQVDVVAVQKLDRVGRNLAESVAFVRWLREHGIVIVSAHEQIDDTPEGHFMVNTWLNMAELFGNQMGQRWAQIIARRAHTLGKAHGHVAQGYVRVDGRLEPDPALASAVSAMFAAYARGEPVSDIAKAFATARGKPMARSRVKVMLRNPLYRGRVVLRSSLEGDIDAPGEHPPLVDDATWEAVARRLAADESTPPRHLAPQYSLTSLLQCDGCGSTLSVWCSHEKGKGDLATPRLICPRRREVVDTKTVTIAGRRKHGKPPSRPGCAGVGSPLLVRIEAVLLDAVRQYAGELEGNPGARAAQITKAAKAGADAGTLEKELARTRESIARLTEGWARGEVPDSAYKTAVEKFKAEEKTKTERLAESRENADPPDPGKTVRLVDEMLRLWPDMTGTERNLALRTVVRGATVRRAAYWREPEADRVVDIRFRS